MRLTLHVRGESSPWTTNSRGIPLLPLGEERGEGLTRRGFPPFPQALTALPAPVSVLLLTLLLMLCVIPMIAVAQRPQESAIVYRAAQHASP